MFRKGVTQDRKDYVFIQKPTSAAHSVPSQDFIVYILYIE